MSRVSIRVLAAAIAVIPALAVAVALGWLASASSRRVAEDLARTLVESASQRVSGEVATFLGDAVRLSDVYARRVETGLLPARGMDGGAAWLGPMRDDLSLFPGVASICFANEGGEAVWLLREPAGLQYGRSGGGGDLTALEVRVGPGGELGTEPLRAPYVYEPAKRVWYRLAAAQTPVGKPVWTEAYFWFGNSGQAGTTGTGYTRALATPAGGTGVLVIDVTLEGLSAFLKRLPVSEAGAVFIVDEQGLLIAASGGQLTGDRGERVGLDANGQPLAAVAQEARAGGGGGEVRRVGSGLLASRAQVRVVRPYAGVDWTVVTVLPESAFLSEARAVQQRATIFAGVATLAGVLLAAVFSRLLARPIESLSKHVRKIGAGDLESQVNLTSAREFSQLSEDVNAMQRGLKHRLELERSLEVAMAVQQSLLPAEDPKSESLDVAGRSKYCDQTGGDYYDFLEVSRTGEHAMLVAVGDVMGHGIGSALLMASARAALRVQAVEIGALGKMLTRINGVLAERRNTRFMTLALVVIDTERRQLRWASAGHDPAIVYRYQQQEIEELEDGDLPLGVDAGAEFREFSRTGLAAGDIILVGTDGIWETRSPAGDMFGKDRLREILRTHRGSSAARIAAEIERQVNEFRATGPQEDDVTFVVAVVKTRRDIPGWE